MPMSKKTFAAAASALVAAAVLIALFVLRPTGVQAPSNGNGPSPASEPFGADVTLGIGDTARFEDGLALTLVSVDDSRCRPGVQCIWAGELSPLLRAEGGQLAEPMDVRLGTTTRTTAGAGPYDVTLNAATETSATVVVSLRAPAQPTSDERIRVSAPSAGQVMTSPFVVTGEARGNWYFEASFPVTLLDANGKVVVAHYAQAQGEWMTTEFVPFTSTLTFAAPATATGTLVLSKDNPSGLPEHDASVRIPVRFRAEDAPTTDKACHPTGCSGQICADEDMVSTCEFRAEYACYRTATCARQANGTCGWTQTPSLALCLKNPPPLE